MTEALLGFGAIFVLALLRLPLARTTTGWTAPAEIDTRHDWNLQLTPANRAWRIRGRLQKLVA